MDSLEDFKSRINSYNSFQFAANEEQLLTQFLALISREQTQDEKKLSLEIAYKIKQRHDQGLSKAINIFRNLNQKWQQVDSWVAEENRAANLKKIPILENQDILKVILKELDQKSFATVSEVSKDLRIAARGTGRLDPKVVAWEKESGLVFDKEEGHFEDQKKWCLGLPFKYKSPELIKHLGGLKAAYDNREKEYSKKIVEWEREKGLPFNPKEGTLDQHEILFAEVGIYYFPELIQTLGGLKAAYDLPRYRLGQVFKFPTVGDLSGPIMRWFDHGCFYLIVCFLEKNSIDSYEYKNNIWVDVLWLDYSESLKEISRKDTNQLLMGPTIDLHRFEPEKKNNRDIEIVLERLQRFFKGEPVGPLMTSGAFFPKNPLSNGNYERPLTGKSGERTIQLWDPKAPKPQNTWIVDWNL